MEKRSISRLPSHDRRQSGCMQSLINMFDFRHGHPSQKLLSDRNHGSRRAAAYPEAKFDTVVHDYGTCNDAQGEGLNGNPYTDDSQMSMRELMEEEMFQLCQRKQTICHEEEEQRQNPSANPEAHGKRRFWRSKMSFDLNDIKFTPEKPTHRKHKSLSSLDVNDMVAELCCQIHHPDVDDQCQEEPLCELQGQSSPALEDKLQDATKVLVSHFVERKNFATGEIMQPSRDLLDALHLLKLNKDMIMKHLQDPDSQLVKQLRGLKCHQHKDNDISKDKQDKQKKKYPIYFWRKLRGLEINSSKKGERAQDISKIVVLKPGSNASQNAICRSQVQKASSHFSLFELTRRLKRSMGKELPTAGRNLEKLMGGDILGVTSSSRGYLPKASTGFKRKYEIGVRSKEIGLIPEQRISKFYSEASKHLAESLSGGSHLHVDFLRKQATKPLGTIISYGDYSSSPQFSLRVDGDLKLLTSEMVSASKESQDGDEVASQQFVEQRNSDLPTYVNQRRGFGNAHELADDVTVPRFEDSGDGGQIYGNNEPFISAFDFPMNAQDAKDIITSANFPSERNLCLRTIRESCSPSISNNVLGDGMPSESEAKGQPLYLNLDSKSLSSPLASPSFSLKSEDTEGQDDLPDKAEHPSPVSVLDIFSDENDMSPPTARSSTASQQPVLPRKINFEVHTFPPVPCSIMWVEEKDSVFKLVNVIIQASGLTWDELLEKFCFSCCPLESSFFDELESIPDLLYYDLQLLFDLIVEVLDEICRHDFDGVLSRGRPHTASRFRGKEVVDITWEGVLWHLQLEGLHHTLDQIIARDYAKSGRWVEDVRVDTESIAVGIEEAIMEELVGDTILNCFGRDSERICSYTC